MIAWLKDLNPTERRTMTACWAGWTLDGFDQQLYSFVVPTMMAVWGLSAATAGSIGMVTLLTSSFGGWVAGALSDRFGRVKMLQVSIIWYSVVTGLCGLAQNFEQLFWLRAFHGIGFGGEWAAGSVLIGEVIRDRYRGRAVGFVQTGAAFGPGLASLVYAGLYAVLPETEAWRVLFFVGIVPALLVLWIRRSIPESASFQDRQAAGHKATFAQAFAAFRGVYLWTTVKITLMAAGAQGGVFAVQFWMTAYLRNERHVSASTAGLFFFVQMIGALIGFLIGAYVSDAFGRKWTFGISAITTFVMVNLYIFVPMGDTALLICGVPLSIAILMKFSAMGPFMTEMFPTAVRGTAQGFCYNGGRAVGAIFPTAVGFGVAYMPLGASIALFCSLACLLMLAMLLILPETRGREIANLETPVRAGG